jgi:hypothetical protein
MHRDQVGRFSTKSLLTRFAIWLFLIPFRIAGYAIFHTHAFLSAVLPSRKTIGKVIWYQFVAIGWLLTIMLLRQAYVVRCAEGGYFMSKAACGELAQNKFDSQELARQQFINSPEFQELNADILK